MQFPAPPSCNSRGGKERLVAGAGLDYRDTGGDGGKKQAKANLLSVFPSDRFLFGIQHVVIDLPGLHFQVTADAVGNGLIQFM